MEQKLLKSHYEKTYNIEAAKKLDEQVYQGMALDFEEITLRHQL